MHDTELSSRRVLATGGAVLLGSHLAHALALANDVRVLDDFSRGRRERIPEGVDAVVADPPVVSEDGRPGGVDRSRTGVSRVRRNLDLESTVPLEEGLASVATE